jgi:hypothetical protein
MKYTHDANTRSCLSYYGTNNNIVNSFVIRNNFLAAAAPGVMKPRRTIRLTACSAPAAAPYFLISDSDDQSAHLRAAWNLPSCVVWVKKKMLGRAPMSRLSRADIGAAGGGPCRATCPKQLREAAPIGSGSSLEMGGH